MVRTGNLRTLLLVLVSVGMLVPQGSVLAGESRAERMLPARSIDLLLHDGGLLVGRVVDSQGTLLRQVSVSVYFNRHEVARTSTDAHGVFRVRGLRPGVHRLLAGRASQQVRLCNRDNAPETARPAVLLVNDTGIVLGNDEWCGEGCIGECGGTCGGTCGGSGLDGNELTGLALVVGTGVLGGVIGFNHGLDNDRPTSP